MQSIASMTANFMSTGFGVLWSVLLLDKPTSLAMAAGGGLIVVACLLVSNLNPLRRLQNCLVHCVGHQKVHMQPHTDLKVEETKLFSLYIHELWWLSHAIKTKTEKLFAEAKVPETGYTLQVSPELHSLIASVLSDAANLKKLIVTPSARLPKESGRQYRLRKARTAALNEILKSIDLAELVNAKVRNTLEHFDEYLDEANLAVSEAKSPPAPIAAYNIVLSHWEVFGHSVYPIRVYVSSERKFYNMKWSVDLGAMHTEASAIVERLLGLPGFSGTEGPGALILHLASRDA